jgi:hypothetical protein
MVPQMDLALLGYQHIFSHKPSPVPIVRLLTYLRGEMAKKKGLKNRLKSYLKTFLKLFLFSLIQLVTVEYIIVSDPMISRLL